MSDVHVLATALFDRPAFDTCVAHGIVLGNDGQKMSKSLRNYPDVTEVFDRDGSDAMRWFLMASPILRGGNLVVTEQGIREGVQEDVAVTVGDGAAVVGNGDAADDERSPLLQTMDVVTQPDPKHSVPPVGRLAARDDTDPHGT